MVELTAAEFLVQGLSLVGAMLYVIVGFLVSRREVSESERGPLRGFVLWWYGLGFIGVAGVAFEVGFNLAELGLTGALAVVYTLIGAIFAIIAGLVYYLLYLYTGSKRWFWAIAGFYALQMAFLVWLVQSQGPYVGLNEQGLAELMFRDQRPPGDPVSLVFSLGLLLPPLAAAIAYAALFFRVEGPTLRYRVALVSSGLILWFTYSLMGSLIRSISGIEEASLASEVAGQLLGILAGALVLLAYYPPRWVQRRFEIDRLETRGRR